MNLHDTIRYKSMSRPQFIHLMKDMFLLALERAGGTDEFAVITSLVMEDADPIHKSTFRRSLSWLDERWHYTKEE